VAAAGLVLWSWWPFAAWFAGTLERRFPLSGLPPGDAGAIVVLSANIRAADASQPQSLPGESTYVRCAHAAWLYRHWKPVPIVVSGGLVNGIVAAEVMKRIIAAEGVPADQIWTEGESRSTAENAAFSAAMLKRAGIRKAVVVTEAYHMLRSIKCFRSNEIDAVAAPCSARFLRFQGKWSNYLPSPTAIAVNEDTLHEWSGLFWYWARGRF
jgi:uncharacterized SAM-binding protein YcdF (DUF218 family)